LSTYEELIPEFMPCIFETPYIYIYIFVLEVKASDLSVYVFLFHLTCLKFSVYVSFGGRSIHHMAVPVQNKIQGGYTDRASSVMFEINSQ
jgi:hypothetical protein